MPTNESELKDLMIAACEGSARAQHRFLSAVASLLRGYFRGQLARYRHHSASDVEDLVQETLIAVHLKRHTYQASSPVTAWIFGIARYKLIDQLRSARLAHASLPIDEMSEVLPAPDGAVESSLDLETVMKRLPARARELILNTKVRGYSISEAAAEAGMSSSAAKVAIHRGIKSLTRCFAS